MDFVRKANADTTLPSLQDNGQIKEAKEIRSIPKDLVRPSQKGQIRTKFNERKILELRENIRKNGQIQPIVVEPDQTGNGFVIIAGERRWRAIQGIEEVHDVECIVKDFPDERSRFIIQLSENFDRDDLSVADRAVAIDKLVKMYDGDIENAAKSIGKTRSTLIRMSSILLLPVKGKEFVNDGFTADYSAISMLQTLFKADEKAAEQIIEKYRRKEDDRPLREALRVELDQIAQKKPRVPRQKQKSITANAIYMQDDNDKLHITSRSGLLTIKLDKMPDDIRNTLLDLLNTEGVQ